MLTFFQMVCKFSIEYFLQFVHIRNSSMKKQQSAKFIPKQLLQNKPQRKLSALLLVLCFVSLKLFNKTFPTFHVTFINIINVDKNNKHVY